MVLMLVIFFSLGSAGSHFDLSTDLLYTLLFCYLSVKQFYIQL